MPIQVHSIFLAVIFHCHGATNFGKRQCCTPQQRVLEVVPEFLYCECNGSTFSKCVCLEEVLPVKNWDAIVAKVWIKISGIANSSNVQGGASRTKEPSLKNWGGGLKRMRKRKIVLYCRVLYCTVLLTLQLVWQSYYVREWGRGNIPRDLKLKPCRRGR